MDIKIFSLKCNHYKIFKLKNLIEKIHDSKIDKITIGYES